MKKKILLMVCVCITMLALLGSVYASSPESVQSAQEEMYSLEEMRTMAMNALNSDFYMEADNGTWEDVVIVKETPLYDLNNTLTSYCFDLRCGEQKAYIVISANSTHYPVRQFSNHATSAYMNMGDKDTLVYCGPGEYYQLEDESVRNILTSETVSISDIEISPVTVANDFNEYDYRETAALYISGDILNQPTAQADPTYKKLSSFPNYGWYKGCAPTSMAMILDYHYSNLYADEEKLIEALASNMGTSSTGFTYWNKVASGTTKTLNTCDRSYTSVGYVSTNILGFPINGSSTNTFSDYMDEILAGRPVFISMNGAEFKSDNYTKGFGDHAIAGFGYNKASTTNYVIVHTTSVDDRDTQVPVNATDMGDYAWLFVVP